MHTWTFGLGLGEDADVIHVHVNDAAQHRGGGGTRPRGPEAAVVAENLGRPAENGVHVLHQERRHAVEDKGAHAKLEWAVRYPKGRLALVASTSSTSWLFHLALRDGVECQVALAEASRAILLEGKHYGHSVRRCRGQDPTVI